MKEANSETRCFVFSRHGLYFHHTKNQPPLRPPSTISEYWPWFWPHLLSENFMNFFWYKIWVKTISNFFFGRFLTEKRESTCAHFFVHFRTLTCSALRAFYLFEIPLIQLSPSSWQQPAHLLHFKSNLKMSLIVDVWSAFSRTIRLKIRLEM